MGKKKKAAKFPRLSRAAAAVRFRDRLRAARNNALADSEGFLPLVQEIEQLGSYVTNDPSAHSFSRYMPALTSLARESRLMGVDFPLLLDALRQARNDAAHLGAAARRTTGQAVAVALILEDAMAQVANLKLVEHLMVEGPTCAESWQTIAMIRRVMLQHQYSVLPYRHGKTWKLVTDDAVVHFLSDHRNQRLILTLSEAVKAGLKLKPATTATMGTRIDEAYDSVAAPTLLVVDEDENLHGILTPFDML